MPSLFGSLYQTLPLLLCCLHSPASLPQVFTPDAQILITAAVNGSREELESGLRKFINTQLPAKSLARLTWDHDAAWVHDYAQEVLGGQDRGLVCFKVGGDQGYVEGVVRLHGAGAACGFESQPVSTSGSIHAQWRSPPRGPAGPSRYCQVLLLSCIPLSCRLTC